MDLRILEQFLQGLTDTHVWGRRQQSTTLELVVKLTEECEEADFLQKWMLPLNRPELGKKVGKLARVKPAEIKMEESRGTPLERWEITFYQGGRPGYMRRDCPYMDCGLVEC